MNNTCVDLVPFGLNLPSTVGYPKFTSLVRNMVQIPSNKYSIFIGILLSDGWLQINKSGNTRFALKQSLDHFEYFYSVFIQLSHYCSAPPKLTKTKLNSKTFYGISFTTRTYASFTELYNMFYQNGVKIVPKNLSTHANNVRVGQYNLLTYEVLAHWIMGTHANKVRVGRGDGSNKSNGMYLNTQCFKIEEVVFIINVFILKYDLRCSIHMQRGKPTIYISVKSINQIYPKLLQFITPDMRYKFGDRSLLINNSDVANSRKILIKK